MRLIFVITKTIIMTLYTASFETVIWRFYLLMAVVVISFFIGAPELALLSVPIFLSAMLGVSFEKTEAESTEEVKHYKPYPHIHPEFKINRPAY